MTNYPFDTVALTSPVIDWYNNVYQSARPKFGIQPTGDINFQLEQFEVFRRYASVNLKASYVIKHENNNDGYLLFVETAAREHTRQHGTTDVHSYQVWVLAYMKHDFGRILLRRETLADKLIELVHPVELDFEDDKAFSDTYYLLVNDREKAVHACDRKFRNAAMDLRHDHFYVEVVEHTLIAGCHEQITAEQATTLCEFVSRLCTSCE